MASAHIFFRDLNTLSASSFWERRRLCSTLLVMITLGICLVQFV